MINPVFVIAEAGVNHNGSTELAFQLVDAAVAAGADAVKFQTFKAQNLVTKSATKAAYQKQTTDSGESQFSMLKRLELAHQTHHDLMAYCKEKQIEFLSTAFDFESLGFLVNDLGLRKLKIPSGEITNGPLLLLHAQTGCDLILSTGMATLGEVEEALGVVAYGLMYGLEPLIPPSRTVFKQKYNSPEGQRLLKEKVTLLHCTTAYPAPIADININAMKTLQSAFGIRVGYSDHSEGITVPIVATANGAVIIEKHFTLDRSLPGPDHQASLEPDELREMIASIRIVEQIMGDGLKSPRLSEISNIEVARRSIVAAKDIREGDLFTKENLVLKRPGSGRSPMAYWDMLGEASYRNYREDEVID